MKVGDLVRPIQPANAYAGSLLAKDDWRGTVDDWRGIVVGFKGTDVIVFWSDDYPDEWEYPEQLEVINEAR